MISNYRVRLALTLSTALSCASATEALARDSLAQRALRAYYANQPDSAFALFHSAVHEHPRNADLLAWLAEAALRARNTAAAVHAADDALRIDRCNAHAHVVRASLFMPRFAPNAGAVDDDSTWFHLRRAVQCDSADGNAWSYVWKYAIMRRDSAAESRALRALVTSGYLTSPQLTHAGWLLRSLPPNAVLVTAGDMDTYGPLAVQVTQGVRPDVAVVNATMLSAEWYSRPVLARHHLRYDWPSTNASRDAQARDILKWLRRQAAAKEGARPVAFALTVRLDTAGVGSDLQLAGPYWLVVGPGAAGTDATKISKALSSAQALDWRGEAVSSSDRSPILRLYEPHPALMVARVLVLAKTLTPASHDVQQSQEGWIRTFLQHAGLNSSTIDRTVEQLRNAAKKEQ
jgi:hypothetical protein